MECEILEDRLALAGNVLATLSTAGDLKITGDNLPNDIQIVLTAANGAEPAKVTVLGVNEETAINGTLAQPNVFQAIFNLNAAGLRNVSIDMKNAVQGGETLLDGVSILGVAEVPIKGTLSIQGKHNVALNVTTLKVQGGVTVKFGNGPVSPDGPAEGSLVGFTDCDVGPLSITTGNDADEIHFDNGKIRGNLTIKSNGGSDLIDILGNYQPGVNVLLDLPTIVGSVSIDAGAGDDTIALQSHFVSGSTAIKAGKAGPDLAQEILIASSVLGIAAAGSKVKVADVTLTTESAAVVFDGELFRPFDMITVEDVITGRSLTIGTKSGDDDVSVRNVLVGKSAVGNLKITTADGDDIVTLDGFVDATDVVRPVDAVNLDDGNRVTGTTTIDAGVGNDDVQIGFDDLQGRNRFQGKTTFTLGEGDNKLAILGVLSGNSAATFASTATFDSDVAINGGNGQDAVFVLGGLFRKNHIVNVKAGDNLFAATNFAVLGNVGVTTTTGSDIVAFGATELGALVAQNFIGGTTLFNAGTGNDLVEVQNATLTGKVTLTLAAGRDQVLVVNTAVNQATAVINGGSVAENNRGSVNGADLGGLGAPGFAVGGVDANFAALVDNAVESVFAELLAELRN